MTDFEFEIPTDVDPLAPTNTPPSYALLMTYPLFNANARMLFFREMMKQGKALSSNSVALSLPKSVGLLTSFDVIRQVNGREGLSGIYRGLPLYICHGLGKDGLKLLLEEKFCKQGDRNWRKDKTEVRKRLALKYVAEFATFPLLYIASRQAVMRFGENSNDSGGGVIGDLVGCVKSAYEAGGGGLNGVLVFWTGSVAHLCAAAVEDVCAAVVDYGMRKHFDRGLQATDKIIMRCSCTALASVFTTPFINVSVVRRVKIIFFKILVIWANLKFWTKYWIK